MKIFSLYKKFKMMHLPEKIWVLAHLRKAKKAWECTQKAQDAVNKLVKENALDGDPNGGQLDAFRHAFWMALLMRNIGYYAAFFLGKAHEKGNRIDYKKFMLEDGTAPDYMSTVMDLRNNNLGLVFGKEFKNISEEELQQKILDGIAEGKFWKIKKIDNKEFLDWNGKIIPKEELENKWFNKKCIVKSST